MVPQVLGDPLMQNMLICRCLTCTGLVSVLEQILESNSLHELGLWFAGYIGTSPGITLFSEKHQSIFLYMYTFSQLCFSFKVNIGSDL
jgi:hypothetical protein